MRSRRPSLALGMALALSPALLSAAELPPITEAERALERVPFEPEAQAVVLFHLAELRFMEYPREISSFLEVRTRIKILGEEGKVYGEVELPHSKLYRLKSLEGRTVRPDGSVVPLPEDAIFREERSRADGIFVTKAAFPAVEVGAILDLRYVMRWDSIFYLEPFVFSREIPTLEAEIVYDKPDNLGLKPWGIEVGGSFQIESEKGPRGTRLRVRMENLHGIPTEPAAFPLIDLSSRFMMIPAQVLVSGTPVEIMQDWKSVCDLYETHVYGQPRSKNGEVKKRARALAAGKTDAREKARALYELVRDEIRTSPDPGIAAVADSGIDKALADRLASAAEKALILEVMLKAAKLDPTLVWASERSTGRADLTAPNPWWFDRLLVSLELDGKRVFLDPSERGLGFGGLSPQLGGSRALLVDRKRPEVLELPHRTFASNTRRTRLELAVDPEGRIAGRGTLSLSGYHAYHELRGGASESEEAAAESWGAWLEERWPGFSFDEVTASESLDEQWIEVAWSMAQQDEEVLGDETSLLPSRPFGPVAQRFSLTPEERKTPVLLAFPDREASELVLTWPEGWEVEAAPEAAELGNAVGAIAYSVELDPEGRSLTYSRRFDLRRREITGVEGYRALRELYAEAERSDAQSLALLRP